MFIGSMLGAVFGIMGSFASVMAHIEYFVDNGKNKYQIKRKIKRVLKSGRLLEEELQMKHLAKKKFQIYPLEDPSFISFNS